MQLKIANTSRCLTLYLNILYKYVCLTANGMDIFAQENKQNEPDTRICITKLLFNNQ